MSDFIHIIRSPSNPAVAPLAVGQHWINTTTKAKFFSVGTSNVSDWKLEAEIILLLNTQTNVDVTIQDNVKFIRVFGTNPVQILLPDDRGEIDFIVKNVSNQVVTVVKETGTINGLATIEIAPDLVNNIGDSYTFIKQGGQWWLN